MESIMDFIVFIVAVPIAIFYFVLLHKIFDIYYFGCSGMTPVIVGCFFAGLFTSGILVYLGFWLLILAAIVMVGYVIYAAVTGQLSSDSTESISAEGASSKADSTTDQPSEATSEEATETPGTPAGDIAPPAKD